ncbi:hypothetical protein DQM23_02675, partial [Lacticaseibacillus paracasei]
SGLRLLRLGTTVFKISATNLWIGKNERLSDIRKIVRFYLPTENCVATLFPSNKSSRSQS